MWHLSVGTNFFSFSAALWVLWFEVQKHAPYDIYKQLVHVLHNIDMLKTKAKQEVGTTCN
jgi:hypothetical protein